ncbi:leucyl/phenylalanyl-tRNA--protein transferase [Lysobacter korlensis]|uniref:Leucyl/phenylalanyl-tRNA--protein transferase n=2 Tax=Lysobacter korlensis TaxID=553636 RepID=A0ABV6RPU4_9GAMM
MYLRPVLLQADPSAPFPPAGCALREPDGLLAIGGDLSPTRLLAAYRGGIFPWYGEGQPILWWSPDPRVVFHTDRFRLPSRLLRTLRKSDWVVRADTAFCQVIDACASVPRAGQDGTWIVDDMRDAYCALHDLGHAHSIEVWSGTRLVGGLYGVAVGRMFFGESMFSAQSGGSKVALGGLAARLRQWGWPLIDAQVENRHLMSLGAQRLPRSDFLTKVATLTADAGLPGSWTSAFGVVEPADLAGPGT